MTPPDPTGAMPLGGPEEPPFSQPWQAQLFAMTVALNEAGVFTWTEWAESFAPRVRNADPEAYYERWLDALEALLGSRGIADQGQIPALANRWQMAARATPHGQPIELDRAE